jgi:hypothetical protein
VKAQRLNMAGIERQVALLMAWGTRASSVLIALGLLAAMFNAQAGNIVILVGTGGFLLLPIARLALMLAAFCRGGDYRLALVSLSVLAIIALSLIAGVYE